MNPLRFIGRATGPGRETGPPSRIAQHEIAARVGRHLGPTVSSQEQLLGCIMIAKQPSRHIKLKDNSDNGLLWSPMTEAPHAIGLPDPG